MHKRDIQETQSDYMYFERFIQERNIKKQTINHYRTTINKYTSYYDMSLDDLIDEAIKEEDDNIPKRQRSIKTRLLQFRTYLVSETELKISSINNHMKHLSTLYKQFDVEVPNLPALKDTDVIETTYFDLPTKKQIGMALDIAGIRIGSLILFMCSSGTAREECANITVGEFIKACDGYYTKEELPEILDELYSSLEPIVPTFEILRVKTQKRYYTYCTPEATHAIVEWLQLRLRICEENEEELTFESSLWDLSPRKITYHFSRINDELNFGFKGEYRFFRPHSLRKFNGSNIGLSQDLIDCIHGRTKDSVHATYIKTNPEELKKTYMTVMDNVTIGKIGQKEIIHEDFTINLNLNFYGSDYGISI